MKYYVERNLKLYKDYYSKNKRYSEETNPVRKQQFTPGGFPGQRQPSSPPFGTPGRPSGPQTQPQTQAPRQPMGPPPNFTPELPSSERQELLREPAEFGTQFRGSGNQRRRPRDLRNCVNRFTFIWLVNGNSFWFFPVFVTREFVIGFRWSRRSWVPDRLNVRRIFFHQCF